MNAPHWYECTRGRESRAPFTGTLYRCQGCDGLLDVEHDLETLMTRPADVWKNLFDDRATSGEWPYQSGVWSKHEWVHPRIEIENIVSLDEGQSPLVRLTQLAKHAGVSKLWVKHIGSGPTGSFQDLGMTVLVSTANQMIMAGQPIRALACTSTGDMASSLAAYCTSAEIPTVVFFPVGESSTAQQAQLLARGAFVVVLGTDLDGCVRIAHQVADDHSICIVNSMNSLAIQGQKTVAVELVQQLGWSVPDWVIIPSGNLEDVRALGRGFLMMRELGMIDHLPRIVCAQAENVNSKRASYQSVYSHFAPPVAQEALVSAFQMGELLSPEWGEKILCAFNGVVEQVSEADLAPMAVLVDRAGFCRCPQTDMALAALSKLRNSGKIQPTDHVVVLSPVNWLESNHSNSSGHKRTLEDVQAHWPYNLVELPADPDAVSDWLAQALD